MAAGAGVLTSPIFHLALVLNVVCYSFWTTGEWVNLSLSLLPNILGFSLGTYALVFSLITSRIRLALREVRARNGVSYLDELNSLFMHFLLTQIVAILFALAYRSRLVFDILSFLDVERTVIEELVRYSSLVGGFCGSLLFLYALCSIAGAAFAVYRLATLVDPADS